MKSFYKVISIALLLTSIATIAANNASTILLSEAKDGYSLDFLNNDNITGLQFDISLSGVKLNKSALSSCTSDLNKTHTGSCSILKNGDIRVIVFSTSNEILESGAIGKIQLNLNGATNVKISNLLMGTPDMKQIRGEALVDISTERVESGKQIK